MLEFVRRYILITARIIPAAILRFNASFNSSTPRTTATTTLIFTIGTTFDSGACWIAKKKRIVATTAVIPPIILYFTTA